MMDSLRIGILLIFLAQSAASANRVAPSEVNTVITKTYLSHEVVLKPGGVANKYHRFEMPEGHVAIRSFNAEMVDEQGKPAPLFDVYLHHWVVNLFLEDEGPSQVDMLNNFHASEGHHLPELHGFQGLSLVPNAGICQYGMLSQLFGVGAETRRTNMSFPAPYGLEIGNPARIPKGKKEAWYGQIHAIDTRGAVDPWGCLECQCELYNVSRSQSGHPLPSNYTGGLYCCYEGLQCRQRPDFNGGVKKYYLRYTVQYVPMDECVVPLRVYILDVTDTGLRSSSFMDGCKVEYTVEACEAHQSLSDCLHLQQNQVLFPDDGKLVFAVGHQHAGGMGISLLDQDDARICDSRPIYGHTDVPGDEAGFVVGMDTCTFYSEPYQLRANSTLKMQSSYSRLGGHTGVMGLFYLAVAADEDYKQPEGKCLGLPTRGKQPLPRATLLAATLAFFAGMIVSFAAMAAGYEIRRRREAAAEYSLLQEESA